MKRKIYTIEEIQEMTKDVMKKYKIKKAYIFGSYARGEANSKSDVDIIVKRDNGIFTMFTLGHFEEELENCLSKKVDIVFEETYTNTKNDTIYMKKAKKLFYDNIKKDRIKIYG